MLTFRSFALAPPAVNVTLGLGPGCLLRTCSQSPSSGIFMLSVFPRPRAASGT